MTENSYRLIAACIFVVGASISGYFRQRSQRNAPHERLSAKAEGRVLMIALRGIGALLWLSVFAYLAQPASMAWSQVDLPSWLRLAGAGLGCASVCLAHWVFSSLGDNVSPTVLVRANHTLISSGPYRWVRHPLYTVGFLSYFSFAVLAANWLVAALAIVTLVLLGVRIPTEEAELVTRHGAAYRKYARETGRFLLRLWPFAAQDETTNA